MKKLLPILVLCCLSSVSLSQNTGYKIKMEINGMRDSSCFLIKYVGNQRFYQDTSRFDGNGNVIFSGEKQMPGGIYGVYTGGKILFEIVVNNEKLIELKTDTNDYVMNMEIKKSEENKVFFEHLKFVTTRQNSSDPLRKKLESGNVSDKEKEEINEKLSTLGKELNEYRLGIIDKHPDLFISVIFKTMKEPEAPEYNDVSNDSIKRYMKYNYVKTHFFDDVDFSDERIIATPLYHNKIDKYFSKIIYPIPDSIIKEADVLIKKSQASKKVFQYTIHYLLSTYEKSKIMGMDAVIAHVGKNYYTHELAFWADSSQVEKIQEKARKLIPLLIGKQAIDISLLDTGNINWVSLYSIKSEYTVLVFWDPDCGHCKKELPRLSQVYDSLRKEFDLSIFAVSSAHDQKWKDFIKKNELDFINVAVPRDAYEDQKKATEYVVKGYSDLKSLNYHTTYDVYTTPQMYLLDRNKKIIGKKLDSELLKKILTKEEEKKDK